MSGRSTLALAFAFALAGCGLPEVEVESAEHLDYAWEPELVPCTGTVPAMDAFVPHVADQLGVDLADRDRFSYTWLTEAEYDARVPDHEFELAGHVRGSRSFAKLPTIFHEIVHLVDDPGSGRSFFVEGLAVAFTPPLVGGPRYAALDPRPSLTMTRRDAEHEVARLYDAGGSFVAYLLGRRGVDRFRRLHERLGYSASEAKIRRVFADVYGRDLDAEVDLFLHDRTCPDDATDIPRPRVCVAPTVPWASSDRWIDTRTLDCADDLNYGGRGDRVDFTQVVVSLDIPEDGAYRVERVGDPDVHAVLAPCGRCPWLAEDIALAGGPKIVELAAGHYGLEYTAPAEALRLAGVVIIRERDGDS